MAQACSGEQREAEANLGLVLIVEDDVRTLRLERFVRAMLTGLIVTDTFMAAASAPDGV